MGFASEPVALLSHTTAASAHEVERAQRIAPWHLDAGSSAMPFRLSADAVFLADAILCVTQKVTT